MGQEPTIELPEGLLELKAALEAEWPARHAALRASGVPLNDDEDGAGGGEGGSDDEGGEGGGSDDGDEKKFDAGYVKKLRDESAKWRKEAQEARARAKEYEDQNKTEAQKLEERATEAEKRAAQAEGSSLRLEVALDKAPEGMSVAQVRKLAKRLAGTTREELETDADELFADFTIEGDDGQASNASSQRLRSGAQPTAEAEETDPAKLAEQVKRAYR